MNRITNYNIRFEEARAHAMENKLKIYLSAYACEKDGHYPTIRNTTTGYCRKCQQEYSVAYRLKNKEKMDETRKVWRENNPDYFVKYNVKNVRDEQVARSKSLREYERELINSVIGENQNEHA